MTKTSVWKISRIRQREQEETPAEEMEEPLEGVRTEPGSCRVGEAKGGSVAACINSVKFCRGTRTAEKLQAGVWHYCAAVKYRALESGCPDLNSNPSSATY